MYAKITIIFITKMQIYMTEHILGMDLSCTCGSPDLHLQKYSDYLRPTLVVCLSRENEAFRIQPKGWAWRWRK